MSTKEEVAAIRKALRARGFTGSVRMANGTAYGWVDIQGSADALGHFTDAENAVLHQAFGCNAGLSNAFTIAPEGEQARLTRPYALRCLGLANAS